MKNLRGVAFDTQKPVLEKWGFEQTPKGLAEMQAALRDFTVGKDADPYLKTYSQEVVEILYGGKELGMYKAIGLGD